MNEWVGGPDWVEALDEQRLLGELFALVAKRSGLRQGEIDVALGLCQPEQPRE